MSFRSGWDKMISSSMFMWLGGIRYVEGTIQDGSNWNSCWSWGWGIRRLVVIGLILRKTDIEPRITLNKTLVAHHKAVWIVIITCYVKSLMTYALSLWIISLFGVAENFKIKDERNPGFFLLFTGHYFFGTIPTLEFPLLVWTTSLISDSVHNKCADEYAD